MSRSSASRAFPWLAAGTLALAARELVRRRRTIDLRSRVVLVTGGSRGLGLVLARRFADAGCRLVICARDPEELERARAELEERAPAVLAIRCDVSDRDAVDAMVRRAAEHFGGIDVLVNNAGVIEVGPVEHMRAADFERVLRINFMGSVHTTLAVLPEMRRRGGGRIANITSIGGRVAVPHLLPYDAAKFALVGFSEGMRAELARDGILVTTVVPGLMRTGSPPNAWFRGNREAEWSWFSVGDALPLTSMSAERAAERIVEALRRGEADVTLGWQARLLGTVHALFPGATAELLGVVNRLLPSPAADGDQRVRGMRLATPISPSPATVLMNRAARANNEYGGRPDPSPEHARGVGLAPEPEENA